jgi:adenosine deaminase
MNGSKDFYHSLPKVELHRHDDLGMPQQVLKERILATARASFLPDDEREKLVAVVKKELEL